LTADDLRVRITEASEAWLSRTPSRNTTVNYSLDLQQFLTFIGVGPDQLEQLATVRPRQIAAWRDRLREQGLTNSSIRRKMTAIRSLFSYLQSYGFCGANPAHSDFVEAPALPRDGKTVGMTPEDCRRLLDAPPYIGEGGTILPAGVRDRALLATFAYTGIRLGELCRLRVGDYLSTGGHRVLQVFGKGGKERRVPMHPEAFERLDQWLDLAGFREDTGGPLFRPGASARGEGRDGFQRRAFTSRGVQTLVERYVRRAGLDPNITVHSFRVTALTTARERGADLVDLVDFAGHADPATTLGYIRSRDRLSKSPAYVLKY